MKDERKGGECGKGNDQKTMATVFSSPTQYMVVWLLPPFNTIAIRVAIVCLLRSQEWFARSC
jgi:hypothetical protein